MEYISTAQYNAVQSKQSYSLHPPHPTPSPIPLFFIYPPPPPFTLKQSSGPLEHNLSSSNPDLDNQTNHPFSLLPHPLIFSLSLFLVPPPLAPFFIPPPLIIVPSKQSSDLLERDISSSSQDLGTHPQNQNSPCSQGPWMPAKLEINNYIPCSDSSPSSIIFSWSYQALKSYKSLAFDWQIMCFILESPSFISTDSQSPYKEQRKCLKAISCCRIL